MTKKIPHAHTTESARSVNNVGSAGVAGWAPETMARIRATAPDFRASMTIGGSTAIVTKTAPYPSVCPPAYRAKLTGQLFLSGTAAPY